MPAWIYNASTWKTVIDLGVDRYGTGFVQVAELYVAVPDNSLSPPGTIWELLDTYVAPSAATETASVYQDQVIDTDATVDTTGYTAYTLANFAREWQIEVNGALWDSVGAPIGVASATYPYAANGIANGDLMRVRVRNVASNGNTGAWSPWSTTHTVSM